MPDPIHALVIGCGSFLLLGGFLGWLFGHAAGFTDGREAEKLEQAKKSASGI